MSILIKGMEMPKNCLTCACIDSEYGECVLDPEKRCPEDYGQRAEWCPLAPGTDVWINVYDRLPPAEKEVYVTDGEYIARANLRWSYSGLGEITHWCEQIPLPQPPKEE